MLFAGIFLSPYVVRSLGEEQYGLWALALALIKYAWFFDLGFNTAIVNFVARFNTLDRPDRVNEVLNTALCYFSLVSVVLIFASVFLATHGVVFFVIPEASRADFSLLVLILGLGSALFAPLHIFTSALDGLQRFDVTSRASVLASLVKSIGCVTVVALGYGLVALGLVTVLGQLVAYRLNYASFRRTHPTFRLSRTSVSLSMAGQLARYGVHSFLANMAHLSLAETPPILLGYFRSPADVGYLALPARLLDYAADGIGRVGLVTRSRAAELEASGLTRSTVQLAVYANRYCFALFLPLALGLVMFGQEFLGLLITPAFGSHAGPPLAILTPATAIAVAGQFNSGAILFGLGKHKHYARLLVAESVASVLLMLLVIPHHGLIGAAWITSVLMVLSRGIATPWLLCTLLHVSVWSYMARIYLPPLVAAAPAWILVEALSRQWPPDSWVRLLVLAAVLGGTYFAVAFVTCLQREHRHLVVSWLGSLLVRRARWEDR